MLTWMRRLCWVALFVALFWRDANDPGPLGVLQFQNWPIQLAALMGVVLCTYLLMQRKPTK